jgi:LysM domain-containing protein
VLDPEHVFGQNPSMPRTNVRKHPVRRSVVIALGLAAVLSMAGRVGAGPQAASPDPTAPVVTRTYVVRPGDTLWRIAAGLVGSREDPRPMITRLIGLNRVQNGVILPGQQLRLP